MRGLLANTLINGKLTITHELDAGKMVVDGWPREHVHVLLCDFSHTKLCTRWKDILCPIFCHVWGNNKSPPRGQYFACEASISTAG